MKKYTLSNLTTVSGERAALILANKSWRKAKDNISWLGIMKNRGYKEMDAYTEFIFKLGWDSALLDIPEEKIKLKKDC